MTNFNKDLLERLYEDKSELGNKKLENSSNIKKEALNNFNKSKLEKKLEKNSKKTEFENSKSKSENKLEKSSSNLKNIYLRVGVIKDGKIIDEFIIEDRDITIGNKLDNNIVTLNQKEPKYRLFKYINNGEFELNLNSNMKLILNSKSNNKKSISITSKDKGKIELKNGMKILFQFVKIEHEKLISSKMMHKQFKNRIGDYIDWKFITPLLLSFVVHTIWVVWMQTLDLDALEVLNFNNPPERFINLMINDEIKKPQIVKNEIDKGKIL